MYIAPNFSDFSAVIKSRTSADVERALAVGKRELHHLAALLSPAADEYLEQMAVLSRDITLQRFGRTIQLYGPIYLSNYCTNNCSYCGFSARNRIDRRCLSYEEAEREAEILSQRGFDHILLVSGESEKVLGVPYLAEITRRLREKFAAISIEVQPLSLDDYQTLFEAGVTAVAVYQETYDRELYARLHISGKKRDFDFRLDTPARACEAGMREIGLGTLLGLSDWRSEGLALGDHLRYLRRTYWRTGITVSFPRIRPAAGEFQPLHVVSERSMSQLIFALRLFDPDVGLILSTREDQRFRDGMLGLGPTRYSAGSCTAPGGYDKPELTGEQFQIGDERTLNEVSTIIKRRGFDPVRKDWDTTFQLQ